MDVKTILGSFRAAAPAAWIAILLAPAAAENPPVLAQPVTLTATVGDGGPALGSGLTWRIFNLSTDASGQLALAAKSEDPIAKLTLTPGDYVVHAAYGLAQASETVTVAAGENNVAVTLEAGGLRLNAAVAGDVPIPLSLSHFEVFSGVGSDADRTLTTNDLGPNEILTLNAGTYHVVSYFGDVNAVVRADLVVEPGKLTDATLYHRASQVSFKLVSVAGGEAIADVDWTVKPADGAATVFSETNAFPTTVLKEGDYLVLANRGDAVFNRAFSVLPGQPIEIEVLTSVY